MDRFQFACRLRFLDRGLPGYWGLGLTFDVIAWFSLLRTLLGVVDVVRRPGLRFFSVEESGGRYHTRDTPLPARGDDHQRWRWVGTGNGFGKFWR
jgi:hypothetical protein